MPIRACSTKLTHLYSKASLLSHSLTLYNKWKQIPSLSGPSLALLLLCFFLSLPASHASSNLSLISTNIRIHFVLFKFFYSFPLFSILTHDYLPWVAEYHWMCDNFFILDPLILFLLINEKQWISSYRSCAFCSCSLLDWGAYFNELLLALKLRCSFISLIFIWAKKY